jgi:calmodulin
MSAALVVPDDAEPMPEQQVKQLKQAFSLFDKDGDQSITPKDLLKFMEGLGHKVTEIELEDMIRECNLASGKHGEEGGSSYIEFAAFYTTMAAALKLGDEAEHKGAFNVSHTIH